MEGREGIFRLSSSLLSTSVSHDTFPPTTKLWVGQFPQSPSPLFHPLPSTSQKLIPNFCISLELAPAPCLQDLPHFHRFGCSFLYSQKFAFLCQPLNVFGPGILSLAGKESACNVGDLGLNPGSGRSPGEGKGYPLQYFGLENSMDRIVHGVAKSQTRLSNFHFHSSHLPWEPHYVPGANPTTTFSTTTSICWSLIPMTVMFLSLAHIPLLSFGPISSFCQVNRVCLENSK